MIHLRFWVTANRNLCLTYFETLGNFCRVQIKYVHKQMHTPSIISLTRKYMLKKKKMWQRWGNISSKNPHNTLIDCQIVQETASIEINIK